ncbi:metallophosphoesterase [Myxococcus sp. AM009]|uniref:STAND family AAA ATPase n=1 Tax=Myxococcus sp. AM009 TaxID=2745137 RepID=UPI0015952C65|nr:metallophosphoesterase [Myxococcus sp. AM009]NVI97802.1 metallophosphoesterase [Myxococcus sp. AM009]
MKIGILHLSDIHFRSGRTNPIEQRARKIANSTSIAYETISFLVIAVTGDIAYAGKQSEYEMAESFLNQLRAELKSRFKSIEIEITLTPGNHDCNFDTPSTAIRDILIKDTLGKETILPQQEVIDSQLSVQEDFRKFHNKITTKKLSTTISDLAFTTTFTVAETKIMLRSCNSTWLSQKKEKQGDLLFPPHILNIPRQRPALICTLIHHPFSWFRADNSREIRQKLEGTSDLILTGHEHETGQYAVTRDTGGSSDYIEGGVLQDHELKSSSFNYIIIDLTSRTRKVFHFEIDDENYRARNTADTWTQLASGLPPPAPGFSATKDFADFLRDPGANFTHPYKEKITLNDIFISPNMREYKPVNSKQDIVLHTRTLTEIAETALSGSNILIFGSEKAGRTALAKTVYQQLYAKGAIPVYYSGTQISPQTTKNTRTLIENALSEQYTFASFESFASQDKQKRIAIVDDFHQINLNKKGRRDLIEALKNTHGSVIVTGNDSIRLEDATHADDSPSFLVDFRHYEILEFGFLLRSRLIEKWFQLSRESEVSEETIANQVRRAESIISTVLGQSLIPAYPLFLLVLLQQIEAETPLATTSASYGYFYEVLITRSLSETNRSIDLDTKYTYLADLAFHMHSTNERLLTYGEAQRLHSDYCNRYRLNIPFEGMVSALIDSGVLHQRGSEIEFKYKYAYYYFIARHLRNNPAKIRVELTSLVDRIHKEEEANVLIFLSYLSRDPQIIDAVLTHSRSIFQSAQPFKFGGNSGFLRNLNAVSISLALPDRSERANREEFYSEIDKMQDQLQPADPSIAAEDTTRTETTSEDKEGLDILIGLNVAFKTMQILGQILKTSPGSLQGEIKHEIAKECYLLGLRTLKSIFDILETNIESTISEFADFIQSQGEKETPSNERRPSASRDEKSIEKAKRLVYMVCETFALSILRRISRSVGLDKLERTFDDVLQESNELSIALIDLCVRLDHFDHIPERKIETLLRDTKSDIFSRNMIRVSVYNRMYMYPLDMRIKQRLCQKLDIDFRALSVKKSPLR